MSDTQLSQRYRRFVVEAPHIVDSWRKIDDETRELYRSMLDEALACREGLPRSADVLLADARLRELGPRIRASFGVNIEAILDELDQERMDPIASAAGVTPPSAVEKAAIAFNYFDDWKTEVFYRRSPVGTTTLGYSLQHVEIIDSARLTPRREKLCLASKPSSSATTSA